MQPQGHVQVRGKWWGRGIWAGREDFGQGERFWAGRELWEYHLVFIHMYPPSSHHVLLNHHLVVCALYNIITYNYFTVFDCNLFIILYTYWPQNSSEKIMVRACRHKYTICTVTLMIL